MSYYMDVRLTADCKDERQATHLADALSSLDIFDDQAPKPYGYDNKESGQMEWYVEAYQYQSWRDEYDGAIAAVSQRFPNVDIEVLKKGETMEDYALEHYRNGSYQTIEPVFPPPAEDGWKPYPFDEEEDDDNA